MVRFSTGLRNDLLANTANGGLGFSQIFLDGVIHIYTGLQPASADDAVAGTLVGIVSQDGLAFVFGSPGNGLEFEQPPVSGVLSKAVAENWLFDGIVAGTAGWGRLMGNPVDNLASSTTLPRVDFNIATFGADLNLSQVNIVAAAPNTIDTFTLTFPPTMSP